MEDNKYNTNQHIAACYNTLYSILNPKESVKFFHLHMTEEERRFFEEQISNSSEYDRYIGLEG